MTGVIAISFLKTHARIISNVLILLLVLAAIYIKVAEEGTNALFRQEDLYIAIGALLAFLLLRMLSRRNTKR